MTASAVQNGNKRGRRRATIGAKRLHRHEFTRQVLRQKKGSYFWTLTYRIPKQGSGTSLMVFVQKLLAYLLKLMPG